MTDCTKSVISLEFIIIALSLIVAALFLKSILTTSCGSGFYMSQYWYTTMSGIVARVLERSTWVV